MNGRERLQALLRGEPTDRLAWTALVDERTLSVLPEHLRGNYGLDFYRALGCDIFLLNGWGMPHAFRAPVLRWADEVEESYRTEGDITTHELRTPSGTLTAVYQKGHPVKYPVDSAEALAIYREMWEGGALPGLRRPGGLCHH